MMKWLIVYQGVFFNFYVCIVIAALKRSVVSDALNMDIKKLARFKSDHNKKKVLKKKTHLMKCILF